MNAAGWRDYVFGVAVGLLLATVWCLPAGPPTAVPKQQQWTETRSIPIPSPMPTPCPVARIFIGAIPDRRGTHFVWGQPLDSEGRLIAYAECLELLDPYWLSSGCYLIPNDEPGEPITQPWSVQAYGPPGGLCSIQVAAGGLVGEKQIRIDDSVASRKRWRKAAGPAGPNWP